MGAVLRGEQCAGLWKWKEGVLNMQYARQDIPCPVNKNSRIILAQL